MRWKIRVPESSTQDNSPAKIMNPEKLKKADVENLYSEMKQLEAWLEPKVDPTQWPPNGWAYHPQDTSLLYRVVSEADLKEEMFGSPAKESWMSQARERVSEIKKALIPYFFSKPKDEGTERKEKSGFVVMLKNELKRKLDIPALAVTVAECQRIATEEEGLEMNVEDKLLRYTPELNLTDYRELPKSIKKQFDNALIVTPKEPVFEIVKQEA